MIRIPNILELLEMFSLMWKELIFPEGKNISISDILLKFTIKWSYWEEINLEIPFE